MEKEQIEPWPVGAGHLHGRKATFRDARVSARAAARPPGPGNAAAPGRLDQDRKAIDAVWHSAAAIACNACSSVDTASFSCGA